MILIADYDPKLKQISEPYAPEEFDSKEMKEFANELFNTMYNNHGMGIAAVQVGILKRVIYVHVPGFSEIMFNPKILKQQGKCDMVEGCLSFRGKQLNINRPKKIRVAWLNIKGKLRYAELEGLTARVVLHEIDHLNGIVFTDKV